MCLWGNFVEKVEGPWRKRFLALVSPPLAGELPHELEGFPWMRFGGMSSSPFISLAPDWFFVLKGVGDWFDGKTVSLLGFVLVSL